LQSFNHDFETGTFAVRPNAPNSTDVYVGERIRIRRLALEKSQTWLAEHVDLTFQQIQKYEKGTNRVGASRLQQFASILNVPVSYFFESASAPGDVKRRSCSGQRECDESRPAARAAGTGA
jgi:transcriptional regulator with XRE-family HTH domain